MLTLQQQWSFLELLSREAQRRASTFNSPYRQEFFKLLEEFDVRIASALDYIDDADGGVLCGAAPDEPTTAPHRDE